MNATQFLLIKLSEECNEVSQRALKAAQFGFEEAQPGDYENNRARLHGELDDLSGIVTMLNRLKEGLKYVPDGTAVADKAEKVVKYARYSKELGHISQECLAEIEQAAGITED